MSISNSQEFYICSDGSTKTKADLGSIDTIEFEAFLLGVWHFLIASQRLQANLKGIDKILVDPGYKRITFKLTYSDIEIAPTAASDKNEEKTVEEAKPKKLKKKVLNRELTRDSVWITNELEYTPYYDDTYPIEIDMYINIIARLENNDIRLSRGIFFYLLEKSIETIHPKRNKNAVEKLFLNMLDLTVENDCSIDFSQSQARGRNDKFKYLKELSSADCLDDTEKIKAFSDKLKTNYSEVLSDMIYIRKKYFTSRKQNEFLVVALIEFIRNDDSIDNSYEFLVCSDGTTLNKAQLCEVEEIEFEPFLIGVWHYVISQLDTKDADDENTLDTVFKVSYTINGKDYTQYRSGELIAEQSEMYVELIYLDY